MINKKQKNAIKSPYLGIFCRKERMDIVVIEGRGGGIYIVRIIKFILYEYFIIYVL
jgi:hypothetical protein